MPAVQDVKAPAGHHNSAPAARILLGAEAKLIEACEGAFCHS